MIFSKTNKIEFVPASKEVELLVPPPQPAKKFIPQWYKDVEPLNIDKATFSDKGTIENFPIKSCMPFFDALSSGYIMSTWMDVYISIENNQVVCNYASSPLLVEVRPRKSIPIHESYYQIEFTWQVVWQVKTPPGYGVIYTHPFNNLTLPFTTLTGVVDSDNFHHSPIGNYPFYVKKGFTGLIPAGTPMYQLFPYKKENWESEAQKFDEEQVLKNTFFMKKNFHGVYRKNFWDKKSYL